MTTDETRQAAQATYSERAREAATRIRYVTTQEWLDLIRNDPDFIHAAYTPQEPRRVGYLAGCPVYVGVGPLREEPPSE